MATRAVRYAMCAIFGSFGFRDRCFHETMTFKGNPAAICFLEDGHQVDDEWMQSVAKEINISRARFLDPCYLDDNPRFNLRWFTPIDEVDLCGHATLVAAHFLLSYGLVKCDVIEFATKSGILTATKVYGIKQSTLFNVKAENFIKSNGEKESFSIELNFPVCKVVESDPGEIPSIPETLNGASMINVTKRSSSDDHIVLPCPSLNL
ncbi:phenazine biosynthesis-like domain-containing protein 2 [Dioscorea cayenensis subsp. rotundata]|uniref:Phenazine biosynthesis-like domain-containing protein 2 n=1 Tax=Dioscorea cayennensis subsp. rotundata TaxID=55577 RepID=A0AB40BNH4_DIOCR|nr:phenazine biosynthesis-like domain-containing protein 2 [Dioscorea cayenensis subsp. rotundata]